MEEQQRQKEIPSILTKVNILSGDKVLWVIIFILFVVSVLVVYSSVAKMGYSPFGQRTTADYLRSHFISIIMSVTALLATYHISCRFYRRMATPFYIISLLLTVAVYFVGSQTNDAARWLPIFGFRFQPSELLKVATILMLAQQLSARQLKIRELRIIPILNPKFWFSEEQKRILRTGTIPVLMPVIVSCAVIFPAHTSSAVLVFAISIVMMFIGRVRVREIVKLLLIAGVFGCLLVLGNLGRTETASGRVSTWVHLWTNDQSDKPIGELTDTERSMIAIHDGGIIGRGAGRSVMRARITHPESDYIFALFVEEYGIILAFFLILLYIWIFFRAIRIFERCEWLFAGLLELGLALLITVQALLHVMVSINFLPETGQNLPLISHGGSSMLCTAIAFGIILSISRQIEKETLVPARNESMME